MNIEKGVKLIDTENSESRSPEKGGFIVRELYVVDRESKKLGVGLTEFELVAEEVQRASTEREESMEKGRRKFTQRIRGKGCFAFLSFCFFFNIYYLCIQKGRFLFIYLFIKY